METNPRKFLTKIDIEHQPAASADEAGDATVIIDDVEQGHEEKGEMPVQRNYRKKSTDRSDRKPHTEIDISHHSAASADEAGDATVIIDELVEQGLEEKGIIPVERDHRMKSTETNPKTPHTEIDIKFQPAVSADEASGATVFIDEVEQGYEEKRSIPVERDYPQKSTETSPRKPHTEIDVKLQSAASADEAGGATVIIDEVEQGHEEKGEMPFLGSLSKNGGNTWIISLFVLLHLLTFVITMFVNDCWKISQGDCALNFLGRFSFQRLSENPFLGPSASTLDSMGALRERFLVKHHENWRILASSWLHAGTFQLIVNLSSVIFVGIHLEQKFGPLRTGIIYIVSALVGSLLASLFVQNLPQVCSSSALFGLIGAFLSGVIRNWSLYTDKVAALAALFMVSTINVLLGLLPYLSNLANLGGFVAGFLLGFVLFYSPELRKKARKKGMFEYGMKTSVDIRQKLDMPVCRIVSLVLCGIIMTGLLIAVLHGVNAGSKCSWCRFVDCIPSRHWTCNFKASTCKSTVSGGQLTLICVTNDNYKVFPYTNMSRSRMEDLCSLMCSL